MADSPESARPVILILVFNEVTRDARILRHIAALNENYSVITCGFGGRPAGVDGHVQLNPPSRTRAVQIREHAALVTRRFERFYWSEPLVQQVLTRLADISFDAVVANDLDTLPVSLRIAGGRPVLADLHEYAPRWRDNSRRWMLVKGPYMDYLCRRYLPLAQRRITVADSIAAAYGRNYGTAFETITNAALGRKPTPRATSRPIRLVHTGSSAANRRLEVMIEGAAGVPGVTLDLYLVPGSDRRYLGDLVALASSTSNVKVLDPVSVEELPALHDRYDVGLSVLSTDTYNTRYSLPNKLFDYVQSGLGIIVGPSPEMAAVVTEYGMGEVLAEFSADSLSAALRRLSTEQVDEWKAATCRAAGALAGEVQAERLRAIVSDLLNNRTNSS